MTTTTMHSSTLRAFAIVVSLALALGALPAIAGGKSGSTEVANVEVDGATVWVTLSNSNPAPSSGTVEVTANILGVPVRGAASFKAPARGLVRVAVGYLVSVDGVIAVGLIDDSGPV